MGRTQTISMNPNFLLRLAQADAYAIAIEFTQPEKHIQLYQDIFKYQRYLQHPTYSKLQPGMYTDDTQMSIAVAETLLDYPNPTADHFLESFYHTFKRDPRDGYSRKFQSILESSKSLLEFKNNLQPTSAQNGAAMRSVPLGLISDLTKLKHLAATQAAVTHNTPNGIMSSIMIALMSHFACYINQDFSQMLSWCEQQFAPFNMFTQPWSGRVALSNDPQQLGLGLLTVHAVATLLTTQSTLMGALEQTLIWGGDTDSVAALAWSIGSFRWTEDVPNFLESQLEVGNQYGVNYLKYLGQELLYAEL